MKVKGFSALCLSLATLVGCDDDSGGVTTPPPTQPQKELIELQISPVTETTRSASEGVLIQPDSTVNFVAIGTYSDNQQEVLTDKVNWNTTSDEQQISLDQSGFATGEATGSTGVLASLDGVKSNELHVTVGDESVTKVQITESNKTLPVGGKHKLTVMGQFSDGSSLPLDPQRIQWQSTSPSIVAVDSSGVITQREEGASTIEAMYHEFVTKSEVIGVEADLESIQIVPGEVLLPQGWTTQLYALAIYDSQTYVDITELANWESANQEVLTLTDEAGEVLAQSAGESSIFASWQGVKGSTVVTVESAMLERIMLTPATTNMRLGGSLDFTAMGIYSNGGVVDLTSSVSWASSDSEVTYDGKGGVISTGVMPSANPVEITVNEPDSKVSATAKLTIADIEISSIIVQNADIELGIGEKADVVITAVYDDGSTESITSGAHFTFSDTDVVSEIGGEVTAVKEGSTNFTVEFLGAQASGTITVSDRSLVSIEVTPKQSEVIKGHVQAFHAIGIYDNNSTRDLTDEVVWISSAPEFVFDPLHPGNAASDVAIADVSVSAEIDNITSASVAVTVIDAGELVDVLGYVKDSSIYVDQTTQLVATAVYEGGATEDITSDVVWTADNDKVNITSDGWVSAKSAGEESISGLYSTLAIGPIEVTIDESLSDTLVAIVSTIEKNVLYLTEETNATALAIYANGHVSQIVPEWEVVNTDVASVDTNGKVTALAEGTTDLTAKYNGKQHTIQVTVIKPEVIRTFMTSNGNPNNQLPIDDGSGLPVLDAEQYQHQMLYVWQEHADGRKERLFNEQSVDYHLSYVPGGFRTKESVIFPNSTGRYPVTVNVTTTDTKPDTVASFEILLDIKSTTLPSYSLPLEGAQGQHYFYPATTEQANRVGAEYEGSYRYFIEGSPVEFALFSRSQSQEYCYAMGYTSVTPGDGEGGGDAMPLNVQSLDGFFKLDKSQWQDDIEVDDTDGMPVWGSTGSDRFAYNPWTEKAGSVEDDMPRLAICYSGWSSTWY
ncbi:Ig-like domain-containing protein [Vibrio sp. SCSIO 43135]|uniref:Ig-like domain-containing protein n=1 Tax=Vibrio sp. SCSIO 43135 TaxID=2819096 RepID=UPI00207650FC|nr:Ig-like domain-containing protein [Vibrio sp. SCSIO 43135]USD40085.1 Ig-like domain-containing protein [Vibrio sp. SCSIO 43135]